MTTENIDYARYVDHTLLAMDATEEQIAKLCEEAQQHNFYAVCVNSGYVPLAAHLLQESEVKICSVIGFPLGAGLTVAKAFEAKAAIAAGAQEIDMVINVGWLKSGLLDEVKADIAAVREVCAAIPLKVILKPACSAMRRSFRFVKCVANLMWPSLKPQPASAPAELVKSTSN